MCQGCGSIDVQSERAKLCDVVFRKLDLLLAGALQGEELQGSKMSVREAVNFGLKKLGLNDIEENQRKVVEAYVSGRQTWRSRHC